MWYHMILNQMAVGGDVDYEFAGELPEELTCSICMKVSIQPHLVNCCENQFCKKCLDKWQKKNRLCPHCRSEEFSTILLKQRSRKIGELKVYCPNKQHGCKEELKIAEYADLVKLKCFEVRWRNTLRQSVPGDLSTALYAT